MMKEGRTYRGHVEGNDLRGGEEVDQRRWVDLQKRQDGWVPLEGDGTTVWSVEHHVRGGQGPPDSG